MMKLMFFAAYISLMGIGGVTKDKSPQIASHAMEMKSNSRTLEEDKNSLKDGGFKGEVEK